MLQLPFVILLHLVKILLGLLTVYVKADTLGMAEPAPVRDGLIMKGYYTLITANKLGHYLVHSKLDSSRCSEK